MNNQQPYHLSIVAASRNDNHGGDLLQRMQHFVDALLLQCNYHNLSAELILVEWNPPLNREPLATALRFPAEKGKCDVRIITVPKEIHDTFKYSKDLLLYQMIAKNVGIRRAKGKYILATNIDILFSDKLMKYIKKRLIPGIIYRVDRYDIPSDIPRIQNHRDFMQFCKNNAFRWHKKNGTFHRANNKWCNNAQLSKKNKSKEIKISVRIPFMLLIKKIKSKIKHELIFAKRTKRKSKFILYLLKMFFIQIPYKISLFFLRKFFIRISYRVIFYLDSKIIKNYTILKYILIPYSLLRKNKKTGKRQQYNLPHTNACGDFTLASKDVWERLRGYPEWDIFSWHIDSVTMYHAYISGYKEIDLSSRMAIYHIEHGTGSGYTPEGAYKLFARLKEKNIKYLSNQDLDKTIQQMKKIKNEKKEILFNSENWGFANIKLAEKFIY